MSDMLRITGLISGMDTDATVKKLIEVERIKVDRAEQEKQYLEWQKEDYREIANSLRGFQEEYFDFLKPATNLRSASTFSMFSASVMSGGSESSAVSVSTSSTSQVGSFSIESISQLASKDKYVSGDVISDITTGSIADTANINTKLASNNKMSFTLDGVTKQIELNSAGYGSLVDFATDLTTQLQDAFTNVDMTAVVSGTEISFKIYQKGTTTDESGHQLVLGSTNTDLLNEMGLSSGDRNTLSTSQTLSQAFGLSGDQSVTINGKTFTFASTKTIDEVIQTINDGNAGVEISYNGFSDKFTLESTTEGNQGIIDIGAASGLFEAFKLQGGTETYTQAKSASFVVDGVTTTRDSNTFEFNGVNVVLNETSTDPININVESDTSDVKDMIVKFIDKYNELINEINEKTSERKNYDYKPLTDAQKEELSEDEIEKWQVQARKGTLNNDNTLEKITRELRTSLYESIEGLDISLYDIGIQSSTNYKEAGKLVINEGKLEKALKERPNEVVELFTKQSDVSYSNASQRIERKAENGIAYRIYDVLQDNIRLTRDTNNNRGALIEKAGLETGVDTTSEMAKKIRAMDDRIDRLLDLLADQEERYYQQFSAMESAMSSLASQGEWLASQFGG